MDSLQSNSTGSTAANPQSLPETSLLSRPTNIQSTATSQSDLSTSTNIKIPPACTNNCVAAVSTEVKKSPQNISSADMLGGGFLLAGLIVVAVFAKKVLTS